MSPGQPSSPLLSTVQDHYRHSTHVFLQQTPATKCLGVTESLKTSAGITLSIWHNPTVLGPPLPEQIRGFVKGEDLGHSATGTWSGQFMRLGRALLPLLCISALAFLLCSKSFFHRDGLSSCVFLLQVPYLNAGVLFVWCLCQVEFGNFVNKSLLSHFSKEKKICL